VTEIGEFAFKGCGSLPDATKQKIRQINPNTALP
jgi:hypothetical protein